MISSFLKTGFKFQIAITRYLFLLQILQGGNCLPDIFFKCFLIFSYGIIRGGKCLNEHPVYHKTIISINRCS